MSLIQTWIITAQSPVKFPGCLGSKWAGCCGQACQLYQVYEDVVPGSSLCPLSGSQSSDSELLTLP